MKIDWDFQGSDDELKFISELFVKIGNKNAEVIMLQQILDMIKEGFQSMSAAIDALMVQVQSNRSVTESAIVLINGLATRIEELKGDEMALQSLADELRDQAGDLSDAVVAHTPSQPNP